MKKFLIKLITGVLFLIIIDFVAGILLDRLFTDLPVRNSETSTIYNSLFPKGNVGVLVLGSSTANHHYNTQILSDSLGYISYNAGLDGHDLIYSDMVFESFLSTSALKYVIIDLGVYNIDGSWKERFNTIKSYYGRNQYVTDYYSNETDWKQRLKLHSNLYRYNGALHSIISLMLFDRSSDVNNGYRPLSGTKSFNYMTSRGFQPDVEVLKHLNNIVDKCKSKNIHLALVKSPYCVDNPDFNNWLEDFGRDNNIQVILENKNPYWKEHPELFYDGSHLNSDGADVLTKRVCERIKTSIQ